MKRFTTLVAVSFLAGVMFSSSAFAGVNYAGYRAQIAAQKGTPSEAGQVKSGNKQVQLAEVRTVSGSASGGTSQTQPNNKYLGNRR